MLLVKRADIQRADATRGYHQLWRRIVVRKAHDCDECGRNILPHSRAFARASCVSPGGPTLAFYDEYVCAECSWRAEVEL